MHNNNYYISPSIGEISRYKLVHEIIEFMKEDSECSYRLVIGTDSQIKKTNGVAECDFVTAIVVYRSGFGARYFWSKKRIEVPYVLRDKIYKETIISIETAQDLMPKIKKYINGEGKYALEIHIDVGKIGKTREMLNEVVGMVTGSGYTARTKPDSWGASSVADRHT